MAEYENPPLQPNYENPLVEQDVYEEANAQPDVTESLAAQRQVYRNMPGPPPKQCSSYPEPWSMHSDTNSPRVTYYSSIDNINIYEEIPDIRGSYLSLRDETISEDDVYDDCNIAANKPSGSLHIIREKWRILVAIIVVLALVVAVWTALSFAPITTIADDQSTQFTTPSTKVNMATIYPLKVMNDSCAAIHTRLPAAASGLYTIFPAGRAPGRSVWCDMDTDGGGWTRVQHRQDGSVSFNRTWAVYQQGFGTPEGEFWIGNDDLHRLTTAQSTELRVELMDWEGAHRYAKYSSFRVDSEATNYRLEVSGYSRDAGDSMRYNHYQPFTTTDQDNDRHRSNCADQHGGGWWYASCGLANLNGRYYAGGVRNQRGVTWYKWKLNWYSYKTASMMTRPGH